MVELPSFPSFEWDVLVIDTSKGEDLILGFDFLNHFNPSIYWRQGLITFSADHKNYYDLSKYFINDFSSAKSCADLVGDSRTPSFPSSVHIPCPNSHMSLLSSRDEVFKEIQDHDSLEELWHEEEDPEEVGTMMKVVPSVYHHYLDVLSQVKEEKLPPHHACDHHIELEGSLPQVGSFSPTQRGLHHRSNPSITRIVETNSSNYALGAVLSQVSDPGKNPIAFDSCKHIPAELNYEIHEKELLGIFWALKCWRAFLLSLSSPFEVLTDHSSWKYLMSSKVITCHQACWAEFLSEFKFSITYFPGSLATLPNALSHWDNIYPERGEDFIRKNPMDFQQFLKQDEVQPSRFFAVKMVCFSNLIESIKKKLWQDSQYRSILQELFKGKSVQDHSLDTSSQLLQFKDWVVVPNDPKIQLSILQKLHDFPLAGRSGQEKTLKLFKGDFHWSSMIQFIKDYVSSCQQCSRNKNIYHKKFVLLKPLPISNGPWICLLMDFITQLPLSNSFASILVIVHRFSNMAVFIPTMPSITPLYLAHLFIKNIFSKHGLPSSIVSDRGSLFGPIFFNSSIFQEICQLLTIQKLMERQKG
ncbi:hypothetical protein O181_046537 [Austropuccinia psidii MF-1]|uniref:Integrase catalytic domain-containing protein n=1 Tax=Austropuccinia psidii MF-1 TaxID=1389203 RepID=A0A9Q3DW24_9BASI|nr:hypothetical protein [Austropuccinia psidii MF-1]